MSLRVGTDSSGAREWGEGGCQSTFGEGEGY